MGGLDAFPGTDLESQLVSNGIETLVLAGFLTNCCVESTMRTACEKGFNVITLTDCTATTSVEAQRSATEGTYGMFSVPLTAEEFKGRLLAYSGMLGDCCVPVPMGRTFSPADAKGGRDIVPVKTAVLFIEYQNEFTTEGGKLFPAVKAVMDSNRMLTNSVAVANSARLSGAKVFHAPISFAQDMSDNPNK